MDGNSPISAFSHIDAAGQAHMVDVGEKPVTRRCAVATARVRVQAECIAQIANASIAKGDVLATARIAGIMAAKRTPDLIPLCHPIELESVSVELELERESVFIRASVTNHGKTGVEMEALTAASVAALTVYDMCKAVDPSMVIEQVRLETKSGGRSGSYVRGESDG